MHLGKALEALLFKRRFARVEVMESPKVLPMAGNNALTASGALAAALLESYVEERRAAPSCSPAAIFKAVENVKARDCGRIMKNPA